MQYTKLFEPGQIGNLTIKNRIVMAPLAMGCAEKDQTIGPQFLTYLMERAQGNAGLIILENTRIDDEHGAAAERQASVARDEHIAPLARAVEALHGEGVKVFAQLHHPGRETFSNINGDQPVWSSGSKPCGVCQQVTHEMTTAETELIIKKFIEGAVRSQKAGCDGVELHGAHGYLITQFLSPYTNQRNDRFGGSFERRFQFLKEIVEGIQKACGKDFPISVRLTVDELLEPYGVKEYLRLPDGLNICQELEKLGIAVINVSRGIYESFNSLSEPMTYPQGCRHDLIRYIKDGVKLPVIAVNSVKEPWLAEQMLQEGLVDFVGLGRAVVADPQWAQKAAQGREAEINRCIACTFCFETLVSDTIAGIGPVKCAVNARAARELFYPGYKKDGAGRTVVVVGAGVTGLEAARVMAERDFKPVVLEAGPVVGGQIGLAERLPKKEKIHWIVEWELNQLEQFGVEIRTNTRASLDTLKSYKPYAVFIATGSEPLRPQSIKGLDLPNVLSVNQLLRGDVKVQNKKALVIGSGGTGLEMCELLCENGNDVTVVEMLDAIGKGVYVQHYLDAMDMLAPYKPEKLHELLSHQLMEVTPKGAILKDLTTGMLKEYDADYVVLSLGVKSVNDLALAAQKDFDKLYVVGDALKPGRIESCIRSAFEAAYNL